jgi:DHA2 family multidrug resistance protein
MIVTGVAQLIAAPVATALERRVDARLLTGIGYAMFAAGLMLGGFATIHTGFDEMFWPQVLRGAAVMLCILPTTALALGGLPPEQVKNGSSLFNLLRNLGGAIGLALIDTVLQQRGPVHGAALIERLRAGDPAAAEAIGVPLEQLATGGLSDPMAQAFVVAPLVRRAAAVAAFNEAWWLIGGLVAVSLLALPLMRRPRATGGGR